jgi:hypothetical protein
MIVRRTLSAQHASVAMTPVFPVPVGIFTSADSRSVSATGACRR